MKILATGSAGFIGYMIELTQEECKILKLDLTTSINGSNK